MGSPLTPSGDTLGHTSAPTPVPFPFLVPRALTMLLSHISAEAELSSWL